MSETPRQEELRDEMRARVEAAFLIAAETSPVMRIMIQRVGRENAHTLWTMGWGAGNENGLKMALEIMAKEIQG